MGVTPSKDELSVAEPTDKKIAKVRPKIMFFGDSLTEGFALDPELRYTTLFQNYVDEANINWDVINAGKTGDTILASVDRLTIQIKTYNPSIVCICLGGNDFFLGGWDNIPALRRALEHSINELKEYAITPILVGIMPPFPSHIIELASLNPEITKRLRFFSMYEEIARENKVIYIRSIFESFPLQADKDILAKVSMGDFALSHMFQDGYFLDIVHPNEHGHAIIARTFFAFLKKYLYQPSSFSPPSLSTSS